METKKNTSRPEYPFRLFKNDVEIELVNNGETNEPYNVTMNYPRGYQQR